VWDLKEVLGRVDDDEALLRELLQAFREESRSALKKATEALARGDMAELARAAHTMKGMLKNLAMHQAAGAARLVEAAARHDSREDAKELLSHLEQALARALAEVSERLAEVKA
jgi:HPt (histidine-containing phosphotransfer) domain-containing protein